MIEVRSVKKKVNEVTAVSCSVCKKRYPVDDESAGMELQEFHYINFVGGYASIFGDGAHMMGEIC